MKRKHEETKYESENNLSFGKKTIQFLSKITQGFYFGNDNIDKVSVDECSQKATLSKSTLNGACIDAKDLKKFLNAGPIEKIKLITSSVELIWLLIKIVKESYRLRTLDIIFEINVLNVADNSLLVNVIIAMLT